MNSFYDRKPQTHIDGSLIFKTAEDDANEASIAKLVEAHFNCQAHPMARLAAIDWVFNRNDRIVGVGELKIHRMHSRKFDTVLLSLRKWLALLLAGEGMGVPPIYVSQWSDWTAWVDVRTIDAHSIRIGGCQSRGTDSRSNIEPLILIPLSKFREVAPHGYETTRQPENQ